MSMETGRPNPGAAPEQISPAVFAMFATHLLPRVAQDYPLGWKGLVCSERYGIVAVELSAGNDQVKEDYAITLRKPADIPEGDMAAPRINEVTTYHVLPSCELRIARQLEPADAAVDAPKVPLSAPTSQAMTREDLALVMEAWYDAGIISWADFGRPDYLRKVSFREADVHATSLTERAIEYLYDAGELLMEQPGEEGTWSEQVVKTAAERRTTVGMHIAQTPDRGLLAFEVDQVEERACPKDLATVRGIWRALRTAHGAALSLQDMHRIMRDAFDTQRAFSCREVRYTFSEENNVLSYHQVHYYQLNGMHCPVNRTRQGFLPTGAQFHIVNDRLQERLQEAGTMTLGWSPPRLTSAQLAELTTMLHRLDLLDYPARWG